MLATSIFSFSHNLFNPISNKNHYFKYFYFVVCNGFQFRPFSTVTSTLLENRLSFSSNLKLSSANSFNLEESRISHFGNLMAVNPCLDESIYRQATYLHYFLDLCLDRSKQCLDRSKQYRLTMKINTK